MNRNNQPIMDKDVLKSKENLLVIFLPHEENLKNSNNNNKTPS